MRRPFSREEQMEMLLRAIRQDPSLVHRHDFGAAIDQVLALTDPPPDWPRHWARNERLTSRP